MTPDREEGPAAAAARGPGDQENAPRGGASFCSKSEPAVQVDRTIAAEINRWHALASEHAEKAIEHARRAGALLLQVKGKLLHGEFLPWVLANVHVTPRQAQRYMAAAAGKPLPVRAIKNDTLSHFPRRRSPEQAPAPAQAQAGINGKVMLKGTVPKVIVTAAGASVGLDAKVKKSTAAADEHLRAIEGRPRKHGKPEQVQTVIAGRVKLKDVAPAPAVVLTDAGARVGLAEGPMPLKKSKVPKSAQPENVVTTLRRFCTFLMRADPVLAARAVQADEVNEVQVYLTEFDTWADRFVRALKAKPDEPMPAAVASSAAEEDVQ